MAVDMRRTTGNSARIAAGGLLIVAATFLPGAESAADGLRTEVSLEYDCRFPAGSHAMTAVVSGRFPVRGAVGRPVEPRDVTVGMGLSRAALEELAGPDATAVSALVRLAVLHTSAQESATADWTGLSAPPVDIAGPDPAELAATGPVPTATFGSPGTAELSAGDLTLTVSPLKADGSPATPAGIDVSCRLAEGADGTLATLEIIGPKPENPVEPAPEPPRGPGDALPPDQREKLEKVRKEAGREARNPAGQAAEPCPFPPFKLSMPASAYAAGYTNVKKLNSAALLKPSRLDISLMDSYIADPCTDTFRAVSGAEFEHEGRRQMAPSEGTFLTFGFMPTTATMVLSQVGPAANIDSVSYNADPAFPEYTTVSAQFDLRLRDVSVNGVPLDVGPNCRTVKPIKQTLYAYGTGNPPTGYQVNRGGPMSGDTYIPAFTGCGVGEDLSPLLTASISGGGNYIKMIQAPLCVEGNTEGCPAAIPEPER